MVLVASESSLPGAMKDLNLGSSSSIAKIVSLKTTQAVVSSLNCGLWEKPSFSKKALLASTLLTGRFTKIICGAMMRSLPLRSGRSGALKR